MELTGENMKYLPVIAEEYAKIRENLKARSRMNEIINEVQAMNAAEVLYFAQQVVSFTPLEHASQTLTVLTNRVSGRPLEYKHFENSLARLREDAATSVRLHMQNDRRRVIDLENIGSVVVLATNADDLGVNGYEGKTLAIIKVHWDHSVDDVGFTIWTGDEILESPDPISLDQLDTLSVLRLGDIVACGIVPRPKQKAKQT